MKSIKNIMVYDKPFETKKTIVLSLKKKCLKPQQFLLNHTRFQIINSDKASFKYKA